MRNWLLLSCCLTIFLFSGGVSVIKPLAAVKGRSHLSAGFLFQRTVSIRQRACSCPTTSSCSCCQSVTLLLRAIARNLCVNFTYAQTGLSMTIMLGSNTIRYVSIIDYRAFKVCTSIPDCYHSFVCVNVMEVSQFPRSVTICMQLDIMSKTDNWLINYNCISLSTLNSTANTTTMPGGNVQPGQMPAGQMPAGQMPAGQIPAGQMPAGQMPAGQMPAGQMPAGQMPAGQMPAGQMPAGQMPAGQMPAGQMPAGQMPAGQMPAGQMPAGQMPAGQMPAGQMPAGQMPAGQMPQGQMATGQFPAGQMPQGPLPTGQFLAGQMPAGQLPFGQMPPGQQPSSQLVNGRSRTSLSSRSSRRFPGFFNWVSSKKSREMRTAAVLRMVKNRLNTRESKPVRNSRAVNILAPINDQVSKDNLQEEVQEVSQDRKVQSKPVSSPIKYQIWDDFDRRVVSKNDLPDRLNRRARRNSNKQSNSAMKMQVILRSRKTRLPKITGNDPKKIFKPSINYPSSIRNPKIVNQDTISIPMSELGIRNVITLNFTSSNNAFTPIRNGSQTQFATPRPISSLTPYGFPVTPPVLVLEDSPLINVPIIPEFSIHYDNRTSSFPDRMPPSFGIASRIGPIDNNKWIQSFDRSVEELETVGPNIELQPNSKISEMTSTEFSDGTIIFPE